MKLSANYVCCALIHSLKKIIYKIFMNSTKMCDLNSNKRRLPVEKSINFSFINHISNEKLKIHDKHNLVALCE